MVAFDDSDPVDLRARAGAVADHSVGLIRAAADIVDSTPGASSRAVEYALSRALAGWFDSVARDFSGVTRAADMPGLHSVTCIETLVRGACTVTVDAAPGLRAIKTNGYTGALQVTSPQGETLDRPDQHTAGDPWAQGELAAYRCITAEITGDGDAIRSLVYAVVTGSVDGGAARLHALLVTVLTEAGRAQCGTSTLAGDTPRNRLRGWLHRGK